LRRLSFKKDFAVKKKVLLLHPALIESTARKALYLSVLQQATTLTRQAFELIIERYKKLKKRFGRNEKMATFATPTQTMRNGNKLRCRNRKGSRGSDL